MILVSLLHLQHCHFNAISLIPGLDIDEWHASMEAFTCASHTAFANTLVPPKDPGKPSSIMFCSWYLNYELRKDYRFVTESVRSKFADAVAKLEFAGALKLFSMDAQIDALDFFDSTVIHEVSRSLPGRSRLVSN